MKTRWINLLIGLLFTHISLAQTEMAVIKGGTFVPLYGTDSLPVNVTDFKMDVYPVTVAQYLKYIKKNPKWQKTKIIELFADQNYLSNWVSDTIIGQTIPLNAAVTNVSWFAAKDYCSCMGKRLPTVDEWEFVAMANETVKDARTIPDYNEFILAWYERPKTYKNPIGSTFKNAYGIYDLHGLVWEWTLDFNSILVSGESRKDVDSDANLFCGSGAVGANDLMNYAAFMRYALRGSLKANFAMKNLGFRCVKDIPIKK